MGLKVKYGRSLYAKDGYMSGSDELCAADLNAMFADPTVKAIHTIHRGKATGRILGGNLTVFTSMLGSNYLPDWQGAILFVEDVDENIYRID